MSVIMGNSRFMNKTVLENTFRLIVKPSLQKLIAHAYCLLRLNVICTNDEYAKLSLKMAQFLHHIYLHRDVFSATQQIHDNDLLPNAFKLSL